ncbi:hypothetical protein AB834_01820 [PVC group bacterium (ex Bugula neritina AB1)]|nr:hypothetical protein AB834_01820 [PVC group bacterium (ex Bugula neritina AB1)]
MQGGLDLSHGFIGNSHLLCISIRDIGISILLILKFYMYVSNNLLYFASLGDIAICRSPSLDEETSDDMDQEEEAP